MSTETLEKTIEKLKMVIKQLREENEKFINENRDLQEELLPTKERIEALKSQLTEIRRELKKALNWMEWIKLRNHCECEPNSRCVKCVVADNIITAEQALKGGEVNE